MPHLSDVVEDVGADGVAGDCLERRPPHEAQCGFGGDDVDVVAEEDKIADHLDGLVSGDPAGHANDDAHRLTIRRVGLVVSLMRVGDLAHGRVRPEGRRLRS